MSLKTAKLQTRCPHCQTLFEILEVQLRAASGQARCSCCDNIFNAKKHLTQAEQNNRILQDTQPPQKNSGAISLNGLFEETELEETAFPAFPTSIHHADPDRQDRHPADEKQAASKKKAPSSGKPDMEDEWDADQERPSSAEIMINRKLDPAAVEPVTLKSVEVPTPAAPRQTADIEELIGQGLPTHNPKRRGRPILWSVAILILLTTALAQMAWFSRDRLKPYPEVREMLELVCAKAGCELPPWHEPESFKVSSRSVKTHPKNNSALQIQLVFLNAARFAQPYPQLQLRLYDTNEKLSAQRVFSPAEYLAEPKTKTSLVQPAQSVEVDMALADPGAGITGFKIEFL